ncbi:MAG TPA: branched-chain amino acid ABC transporter permease, partial [Actinomycetota bacterium]|nr:branched-chain amino acid ABC transporter permease [Actinomycetota bacterium]
FGEIVRIAARNFDSVTVGPRGITPIPHPEIHLLGIHYSFGLDPRPYYYLLLFLCLLLALVIVRLDRSRIGRAWVAIREDELAAAAMGVPTVRMKLWAFAIGASTAGVAGVVQASRVTFVSPDAFPLLLSIFILCMVVLGGMGNIVGSVVGAAVIVVAPEIIRSVFPGFQQYRYLVFGAVLVAVMIFRPQGLIPSRRRRIELKGPEGPEGLAGLDLGGPEGLEGADALS